MKVKTSDLDGNALCYAVTMLEVPNLVWGETIGMHEHSNQIVVPNWPAPECYSPYTSWDMCGPIIEREGIELYLPTWQATTHSYSGGTVTCSGPTPLIAAMRCYVTSKLGDEVEIPEELCA